MLLGTPPCGTCSGNDDCASFGAGAYCLDGVCVGGDGGTNDEVGEEDEESGDPDTGELPALEAVSILLVVDNSLTMAEEQVALTTSITTLLEPLDAAGIDWRLGVTTTDCGNHWCTQITSTPENGMLVSSSCRWRINDFLSGDSVDVRDEACLDLCSLDDYTTLLSTTEVDANAAKRPWIERSSGTTNVAEPLEDVLRCFVPMGVNGCGFESQLEAAKLAFDRSDDPGDSAHGFFHPTRLPVVVFVTDEVDCSYTPEYEEIFTTNKTFWSDPAANFPTSALCWNAGVTCTGDPSGYDSCEPVNKNVAGAENVPDEHAVLRPLSRYDQRFGADRAVVYGIVGVLPNGEPLYADAPGDPDFMSGFGIGPGCFNAGAVAVPPVRIRAIAETNAPPEGRKLYSVCSGNFEPYSPTSGTRSSR
ncbi:MAG: hypothetical protein HC927_11895 [Deltaproteobacteria bacterium]|nr:hypothetical protein [Deltaproteobacteria bacterium]